MEAPGASEAEARFVESGCGWRYCLATYGTNVVDEAHIEASAIPAVNRTTLLG